MAFNRFAVSLAFRIALLAVVLTALAFTITSSGYPVTAAVLAVVTALLLVELYRHVSKTNADLTRFLDAVRNQDFSQRFQSDDHGAGFEQLAGSFDAIMQRFKSSRQQQETQLRHLKALTEHMPLPLLSLFPDGRVELHNNAARRLFGNAAVTGIGDLGAFGEDFRRVLESLEPGKRRLVDFHHDGMQRQLTVAATRIVTGEVREKLISMLDIQSELDHVQLQAWQELVRVLTHEMMNSITPVASLAGTATDLVQDARSGLAAGADADTVLAGLEDIHQAVDTVARRADGLMQFVQGYRSLTQLPTPQKQTLSVGQVFDRICKLQAADTSAASIELRVAVQPEDLTVSADPDLLDQVLINLLRNARQALADNPADPRIELTGRLNQRGYVLIDVIDNGPGIPAELADQVFVPFFTTRHQGSGVGLALSRQIMIAHGGGISVAESDTGGARFTLIF